MTSNSPGMPTLLADKATSLAALDEAIITCTACPRLVTWREECARVKRASFSSEEYWGKPIPGFGDENASIVIVGLAPAAHGGNRTGRMFTGDRSGDFLFASLFRVGLASQPASVSRNDGLHLRRTRVTAPVHCAPPENKPTSVERMTCAPFLAKELQLLAKTLKVAVVLGGFGWQALLAVLRQSGWTIPRPQPRFGHAATVVFTHPDGRELTLIGCFHPSQQNTFTGRLTEPMMDTIFEQAREVADS